MTISEYENAYNRPIPLLTDLYEFTMATSFLKRQRNEKALFDLFVRELGEKRNFLIAGGIEDSLDFLERFEVTRKECEYLEGIIGRNAKLLEGLKFEGDVYGLKEGTIFFQNEPVMQIIDSLPKAQLVESALLNTVNAQTLFLSKAARIYLTANGRKLVDFSLRRTHGISSSLLVAKCSYLAGFAGTSNTLAGKIYGIPVAGTMAHSYILAHPDEITAFESFATDFPQYSYLLVDTYDTINGIKNAIRAILQLKKHGINVLGIRIDSGDLEALSKQARKMLDRAGLKELKIIASGNLDEYKLIGLKHAPVDAYGIGTALGTSSDNPVINANYKLALVFEKGDRKNVFKKSSGKMTLPGHKQIFRLVKKGRIIRDVIGLVDEKEYYQKRGYQPLLEKVMENGKRIVKRKTLNEIRNYINLQYELLTDKLRDPLQEVEYEVAISRKLIDIMR